MLSYKTVKTVYKAANGQPNWKKRFYNGKQNSSETVPASHAL